jgi:hypothetical protein
MTSPLATDKASLRPRKLRPSYQNLLGGGEGAIGGGYMLMADARQIPERNKLILTRATAYTPERLSPETVALSPDAYNDLVLRLFTPSTPTLERIDHDCHPSDAGDAGVGYGELGEAWDRALADAASRGHIVQAV